MTSTLETPGILWCKRCIQSRKKGISGICEKCDCRLNFIGRAYYMPGYEYYSALFDFEYHWDWVEMVRAGC